MNKYYHGGSGKVTHKDENGSVTHVAYHCSPDLPVGWFEGREVYQVVCDRRWKDITREWYISTLSEKRIWIEPVAEKNKVTVKSEKSVDLSNVKFVEMNYEQEAQELSTVDGIQYLLIDGEVYKSQPFDQWDDGDFEADSLTDQIRVLISKNEKGYFVSNAMNGYGQNIREDFAKSKVILLSPAHIKARQMSEQEIRGLREDVSKWENETKEAWRNIDIHKDAEQRYRQAYEEQQSDNTILQERVRKLREGLSELLEQYEIECRNYANEAGVPIKEWVKDLPTYQKAKQLLTETE